MYLRELTKPITDLKGVGRRIADSYARLGIVSCFDLASHLPRTYEDRSRRIPFAKGYDGTPVLTVARVAAHQKIRFKGGFALKVVVQDESGPASLMCFGRNFLQNTLRIGESFYIYGQGKFQYGELQLSSFETAPWREDTPPPAEFSRIIPVYPLAGALTQKIIRRDTAALLRSSLQYIENEIPEQLMAKYSLLPTSAALKEIHFPSSFEQLEKARRSLVFSEFLYLHLVIRRRALKLREIRRRTFKYPRGLYRNVIDSLPFSLTEGQVRSIDEILEDLEKDKPMARLIQGDVGSGKTLTALLAASAVIESGRQAAFMVPTELLARQHAEEAAKLLEPFGVRPALLHGGLRKQERRLLLESLRTGQIDLLIGTHALFSQDVEFRDLSLVIIDEQHRFGVVQRVSLGKKGEFPDMLFMTATPIPRTLTMTIFGDLDISTIDTMPPGRKPVITHLASEKSRNRVYKAVKAEFDKGHQAYFVYPRIEQGEGSNLKDAHSMYEYLTQKVFPGIPAGLIHSQVPQEEKEQTMEAFKRGSIVYLVATSVIEVGVHVANASCMVIEHAERFGLSALHQLRGRVGRGHDQAYAFLVFSEELTEQGKRRLKIMKESSDGFLIAEEDLKIRGPGDIAGTQQSGFIQLTFADLVRDLDLLQETLHAVQDILKDDPGLLKAEYAVCREVLRKAPPFREELIEA